MLRVANSTPIVDFDSKLNSFLVNLDSRLLLPTPESPISTTVKETEQKQYRNHSKFNQRINLQVVNKSMGF